MTTPILILAPRITEDSKSLWKSALDLGWSPQRLPGWRVPDQLLATERPIAIYGEPLFAEAVADQLGLILLEPSIDWLTHVPKEYLFRDITLITLAEARTLSTPAFVKPADGKIFDPKVYPSGADLPGEELVDSDIPVLRSGIVDFRLEVRCFIHDRRVQTLSPYWRDEALAQDDEGVWSFLTHEEPAARAFADKVLADPRVPFPPACTLDIGQTSTGKWAIVEANPCWGAGLYGCDPALILPSLLKAIVPAARAVGSDLQWRSLRRQ